MDYRGCIIIPVYNHGDTVRSVVEALKGTGLPVILVDDGSAEDTRRALDAVAQEVEGCRLVRLEKNSGKGGAVIAGLKAAESRGFTHAFQVDADGQHDLERAPAFLESSQSAPEALIAGCPKFDESAPASRLVGRKITNFLVTLETLSRDIPDAMCGFRIYPVKKTLQALRALHVDRRMGFDIEILVRLHWLGVPMDFKEVKVDYPMDGASNFHMVWDNIAISFSHTKLLLGIICRLPQRAMGSLAHSFSLRRNRRPGI